MRREGQDVLLDSHGRFSPPMADLDCGNSGSTLRMLAGVLAGQSFATTLTGDASLRSRPMGRIIEPLALMGARIDSQNDRAPLLINGAHFLKAISYELPVASAQVKSCILFAALNAAGRTEVVERIPTRDHTERILQCFGVPIEIAMVPGSAATSIASKAWPPAGARCCDPRRHIIGRVLHRSRRMLPDSHLVIDDVGLNPLACSLWNAALPASAHRDENEREEVTSHEVPCRCAQPRIDSRFASRSGPQRIHGPIVPLLIDELPLLAVIRHELEGGMEFATPPNYASRKLIALRPPCLTCGIWEPKSKSTRWTCR